MSSIRAILLTTFIIILIIISGFTNNAKAQNIDWGPTAGLTVSSHLNKFWFIEDDIRIRLNPDVAVGYQLGLIGRANISSTLRIQLEPSIILLGAKYDDSFTLRGVEFETDSRTELTYIQLPLLLQLSTAENQYNVYGRKRSITTYHISGGLFGGYLLDARFEGTNRGAPIGIEFEGGFSNDVTPQYSNYDVGPMLGLGLERGHYNKVGFETRAQFSIIDSGSEKLFFFRPQNIALTFSLYVLF
ncbi:outer membrane beta-barrel protein [Fodinibius sp. Rm-B-1B1-1]|uniref:outer membrane beta-barrel protein n=1 Tax=Fodinibius alkaliphilus TaxID=3140241 RepID=UPI003159C23F